MNWDAVSAISDLLASIAVVTSLVYLAIQVKLSNILSHGHTRRDMLQFGQGEIYKIFDNPDIWDLMQKEEINHVERVKLHTWLLASLRLREFEWSQYRFGIVDKDTYDGNREIIPIVLGTVRSRSWWNARGKAAVNPEFVKFVDELLKSRPLSEYWNIGKDW